MKTFSVILPIYKLDTFLDETFNSLLNQTFNDYEIIALIDNLDTKIIEHVTKKFVNHINFSKIKFYEFKNMGLTKLLNVGINLAEGKYIVRNDSDDVSSLNRLQITNEVIDKYSEINFLYSYFNVINEESKVIKKKKPIYLGLRLKKKLNYMNPIGHSSTVFKKAYILQLHGYNEDYKVSQDFELWGRVINDSHDSNACIKDFLVSIRFHKSSISSMNSVNQRMNSVNIAMNNKFYPKKFDRNLINLNSSERNYFSALEFAYLYGFKRSIKIHLNIYFLYYLAAIYFNHKSLFFRKIISLFRG